MSLRGNVFLALWNDVTRSREPEYDRWHTLEHVPERVAVSGFNGARRYVNRTRETHRYFTLYEVDDVATFDHPEYVDLVKHPTTWTASMRSDFRNAVRASCTLAVSRGEGIAVALGILCFNAAALDDITRAMDHVLADPGVTACHLGRACDGGVPMAWMPPSDEHGVRAFDHVFLIEALERESALQALTHARILMGLANLAVDFGNDVYDLAFVFPGHNPDERRVHRRRDWPPEG
ncbi:MAG: hypothetical protein M3Z31_14010 [Pseudomonadota bacterium]|nr:hypothetical protein [Pseudomonadota bacterium]